MCKRKIKTVKVLLSLLLFAAVMFQIPSDVHAQVETMTTKPALCSKAVSYSSAAKASAAKKATATFRSSKTTLWVGHKVTMRSLITLKSGTSLSIKSAKSSRPSVLAVSGSYLVPKKAGTAVVTAKLNGVSRRITITVSKLAAKPTVKNLKTSVVGIKYGPNNMKTYYTLKVYQYFRENNHNSKNPNYHRLRYLRSDVLDQKSDSESEARKIHDENLFYPEYGPGSGKK